MSADKPILIIITGPPGAGKTSIARPLAREFGLPLIQKDTIKERYANTLGERAADIGSQLGLAATMELYANATELLRTGRGVVIESFFHKGKAEDDLLALTAISNPLLIHLRADNDVLMSRYERRMADPDRHPIHNVGNQLGQLRHYLLEGVGDPLDLEIPRIIIDTTFGPVDIEEVAHMAREHLQHD